MKPEKTTVGNILTTILTPLVGAGSAYLAKKGLHLPAGAVVTLGAAGAAATLVNGFHWLQRQTLVKRVELLASELGAQVAAHVRQDPATLAAQRELVQSLESQKDAILQAIAKQVGVPPSAEEVAQKILDQAVQAKAAAPAVRVAIDGQPVPAQPTQLLPSQGGPQTA